ncbi:LepB GTPase-activating domain-containing protein [Legionella hackeliae]|nr:LepB GTPase-activating domain-containing protein [Legionella hackeliae]KTD13489.1 effector protein B, substrate of the Dot/Icm secretion system [Legionella hackeliae]
MPTYKGLELEKFKDKTGGKNKGDVDGFYRAKNGEKFLIKQPADRKELFTELFAGLLLKQFSERLIKGLIDEGKLQDGAEKSLIFAEAIQLDDGSYALIQPFVSFIELFRIIGTGYKDDSDRDALWEIINGPSAYPALTHSGQYFGLSLSLMFSLLLGAYSVHSANIARLIPAIANPLEAFFSQFARIDWGDAFRLFASEANNKDILFPAEYEGFFNFKKITKGYIQNYQNIFGLFTSIAEKGLLIEKRAKALSNGSVANFFSSAVLEAFRQMPKDLFQHKTKPELVDEEKKGKAKTVDELDQQTKKELAKYLAIPSFEHVTFGEGGNYAEVAAEFAKVLEQRLTKITQLKEQHAPQEDLYQSVLFTASNPFKLIDETTIFSDFVTTLDSYINKKGELNLKQAIAVNFDELNLTQVAEQYNHYIDLLASQTESFRLWPHDAASNRNLLATGHEYVPGLQKGHAFVPYYRESTILRRLSTIDTKTLGIYRFVPYEEPSRKYGHDYGDSVWKKMDQVASSGNAVIGFLKVVQKMQKFISQEIKSNKVQLSQEEITEKYKVMEPSLSDLSNAIIAFNKAREALSSLFTNPDPCETPDYESSFFYPISDKELHALDGLQLATICFEELNAVEESLLLFRIINDSTLWGIMDQAITDSKQMFFAREDNIERKYTKLYELHAKITSFHTLEEQFTKASSLEEKAAALEILEKMATQLPAKFQGALTKNIDAAREKLSIQQSLFEEYRLSLEVFDRAEDKIGAFESLQTTFKALPLFLQTQFRQQFNDARVLATFKQHFSSFKAADSKDEIYLKLLEIYKQLPARYQDAEVGTMSEAVGEIWKEKVRALDEISDKTPGWLGLKQEYFTDLQAFFDSLPKTIGDKFKEKFTQLSYENGFYQGLEVYNSLTTVAAKIHGLPALKDKADTCQSNSFIQQVFSETRETNDHLSILQEKGLITADAESQKVEDSLATLKRKIAGLKEPAYSNFIDAVIHDKTLWEAVQASKKAVFSNEIISDLLALKDFLDKKLAINKRGEFGQDYSMSLNKFYETAVAIRLSTSSPKDQAHAIIKAAHHEFAHRDSGKRLIADIIMTISVVGLFIGVGRLLSGRSFFFSQAKTERETEFTTQWLQNAEKEDEDTRIIVTPPAA